MDGSSTASDCELIHAGWPDQPVNAYSAVAFVVVGLWLIASGSSLRERLVGAGSGLVGVGSLMFHGAGGSMAAFLHDWSIVVLGLTLLGVLTRSTVSAVAVIAGAVASGVLLAVADGIGAWVQAAAVAAVVARVVVMRERLRRAWLVAAVASVTAGSLLFAAGRSGGFWCVPESVIQPHAGWHLLAAGAVAATVAASRDPEPVSG